MSLVAQAAGVSQSTVSRVVNGRSFVRETTRQRVLSAMKDLGYAPPPPEHRSGRNPKLEHRENSGLLAMLVNPNGMRLHADFVSELYQSAQQEANREGYSVILHYLNEDLTLPPVFEKVDGYLLVGSVANESASRRIIQRAVVSLTSVWKRGGTAILAGNDAVGKLAADYLIAQGHARIALVQAERANPSYLARGQAFQRRARAKGIPLTTYGSAVARKAPDLVYSLEALESRLEPLVEQFIADNPRATGIFCPSDAITALCYRLLAKHGLQPGNELEFISCDHESSYLAGLHPRPATIDLGIRTRARLAVQHLVAALREDQAMPPVELKIEPQLVPGERS